MWFGAWFGCAATTGAPTSGDTGTPPVCPAGPGEGFSFEPACVGDFCGGTVWPEARAQLGEPDACAADVGRVTCAWGPLSVTFPDCDRDGAPDEEAICDLYGQVLTLGQGFAGTDVDHGLGLGDDAACFAAALGAPVSGGWSLGDNPWVRVTVEPAAGPVTAIHLDWSLDE